MKTPVARGIQFPWSSYSLEYLCTCTADCLARNMWLHTLSCSYITLLHCVRSNTDPKNLIEIKVSIHENSGDDGIYVYVYIRLDKIGRLMRMHMVINHYCDVIMGTAASQTTSFTIVYSTVHLDTYKRKISKPRVTGLFSGNSPVTDEFPAQRASKAENMSIWRRHLCDWGQWWNIAA